MQLRRKRDLPLRARPGRIHQYGFGPKPDHPFLFRECGSRFWWIWFNRFCTKFAQHHWLARR